MRGQSPTTPWEIEAARHREVVASDFGTGRISRSPDTSRRHDGAGIVARFAGWVSAAGRSTNGTSTGHEIHAAPCSQGPVRAMKPGG